MLENSVDGYDEHRLESQDNCDVDRGGCIECHGEDIDEAEHH